MARAVNLVEAAAGSVHFAAIHRELLAARTRDYEQPDAAHPPSFAHRGEHCLKRWVLFSPVANLKENGEKDEKKLKERRGKGVLLFLLILAQPQSLKR